MTSLSIHSQFYAHYDRSACLDALRQNKLKEQLGAGRHFQSWAFKELAICIGENLPEKWDLWIQKVIDLGPQPHIPPIELIKKNTLVMPILENRHSIHDNHTISREINQSLRPLGLQLQDIQIGEYNNTFFAYDWSDLTPR